MNSAAIARGTYDHAQRMRASEGHRPRVVLSHVHRPAAVELHHPAGAGRAVGGELLVVDRPRGGHVEDAPAGVSHSLLEVDLLRVDEEVGVQVAHLLRGLAPHQHGRRLHPAHLARPVALAAGGARVLGDQPAVQEQGLGQRRCRGRAAATRRGSAVGSGRGAEPPRRPPWGRRAAPRAGPRPRPRGSRSPRSTAGRSAREPRAGAASCSRPGRRGGRGRSPELPESAAPRPAREPSSEALSSTRISCSIAWGWVRPIASRQVSRSSRPFVFTTQ